MSYVNVKCTRGGNGWCLAIEPYLKAWKLYSSSKKSFFAAPGYENEREESVAQTWSHHEERPIILSNGLTNSDQRNWCNTMYFGGLINYNLYSDYKQIIKQMGFSLQFLG